MPTAIPKHPEMACLYEEIGLTARALPPMQAFASKSACATISRREESPHDADTVHGCGRTTLIQASIVKRSHRR